MSARAREKSLAELSRALREELENEKVFAADEPENRYVRGRVTAFKHALALFDLWTDGDFKPAEGGES